MEERDSGEGGRGGAACAGVRGVGGVESWVGVWGVLKKHLVRVVKERGMGYNIVEYVIKGW